LKKEDVFYVPDLSVVCPSISATQALEDTIRDEYKWLKHGYELCKQRTINNNDWVSWAAYHANNISVLPEVTSSCMLPVFREISSSASMVNHAMDIAKASTDYLNPGQKPVIVADQPLYALMKKIQWKYPEAKGEDEFVVMLGGLHIEKMLWEVNGTWFQGSGWTTTLANSGIATTGVADSCLPK